MFPIPAWYDPKEEPPKTEWFYEVCDMSKNEMSTLLDELYHREIALFKPRTIQIDGQGEHVPMELVCPKHYVEYLKNKYGDWIMYEPELDKKTALLWILPLILFVFGGLLIFKKAFINYNKNV